MPNDYRGRWDGGDTGGGFNDGPNMGNRYKNNPGPIPVELRETRGPMTREEELRYNIESALRPLYDQSIAQLEAQRLAQNAAIDVDAYSRGMGGSTWVTDAKLQALRGINANIASLEADYNTKLYNQLQAAVGHGGGGGGGGAPQVDPNGGLSYEDYLKAIAAANKGASNVSGAVGNAFANFNSNKISPKVAGGIGDNKNMVKQ